MVSEDRRASVSRPRGGSSSTNLVEDEGRLVRNNSKRHFVVHANHRPGHTHARVPSHTKVNKIAKGLGPLTTAEEQDPRSRPHKGHSYRKTASHANLSGHRTKSSGDLQSSRRALHNKSVERLPSEEVTAADSFRKPSKSPHDAAVAKGKGKITFIMGDDASPPDGTPKLTSVMNKGSERADDGSAANETGGPGDEESEKYSSVQADVTERTRPRKPNLVADIALANKSADEAKISPYSASMRHQGASVATPSRPLSSAKSPDDLRTPTTPMTPIEGEDDIEELTKKLSDTTSLANANPTSYMPRSGVSRTQQKLLLQKASSISDEPDGAMADRTKQGRQHQHPRARAEFERVLREYTNARRFRDPFINALNRTCGRGYPVKVDKHREDPTQSSYSRSYPRHPSPSKLSQPRSKYIETRMKYGTEMEKTLWAMWNEKEEA